MEKKYLAGLLILFLARCDASGFGDQKRYHRDVCVASALFVLTASEKDKSDPIFKQAMIKAFENCQTNK